MSSHCTRHVAPSVPCQSRSSQPVSTQALGEVPRRLPTRIGAPQVGQRAARGRGGERGGGVAIEGVGLHDHEADGRERDGTAGMAQTEVADFHEAVRQDMLEEPAEKLDDVKVRGS